MEIKICDLKKCPIFREILSKDWVSISKEVEKVLDSIEYFTVEYNTDTSAGHPNN